MYLCMVKNEKTGRRETILSVDWVAHGETIPFGFNTITGGPKWVTVLDCVDLSNKPKKDLKCTIQGGAKDA